MRQRAWIVTMAVGVLGSTALAPAAWPQAAPATIAPPVRLDEALSLDPAVRVGRLPDGITYYIRKNGRPEKRVSLRLAVKAGSVLEDEDQRGLAHFLEHMSFNGSEHVPFYGDIFGNGLDHEVRSLDVGIPRSHVHVSQAGVGLGGTETPVSDVGSVPLVDKAGGALHSPAARGDDDGRGPQS